MRESNIVNRRIENQKAGEQPDGVNTASHREEQTPPAEDGGGQKERIFRLFEIRDLRKPRQSIPEINKAAQGKDCESFLVRFDPTYGVLLHLSYISSLAHRFVALVLHNALGWVHPRNPNSLGNIVVAAVQLDSEVATQHQRLVEDAIVANEPGREHG